MILTGLDHIGIVVKSVDQALGFFSKTLGLAAGSVVESADYQVKLAKLELGETIIELIEPLSRDSSIASFLKNRREGVHHIAIRVNNIEAALSELKNSGIELIDEKPRRDASDRKIAFIAPQSCHGVLIELCESEP